jgi:hypothetical protein
MVVVSENVALNIAFSSEVDTGSRQENASELGGQNWDAMASQLAGNTRAR